MIKKKVEEETSAKAVPDMDEDSEDSEDSEESKDLDTESDDSESDDSSPPRQERSFSGGSSGGSFGDRQMFTVKCSDCGKDAEVPFKPDPSRPVYCRDCFSKHRKPRRNFGRRRF